MFKRNRGSLDHLHIADHLPRAVIDSADEAAAKVVSAADSIGTRVATTAARANGQVSELTDKATGQAVHLAAAADRARTGITTRRARVRRDRRRQRRGASHGPAGGSDGVVAAQLAAASVKLAAESAGIGEAVVSLKQLIKANRRAGARQRTNLVGGLVVGACLMYHLDPEQGPQRRADVARRASATTARLLGRAIGDADN